jgi:hypothetical protein
LTIKVITVENTSRERSSIRYDLLDGPNGKLALKGMIWIRMDNHKCLFEIGFLQYCYRRLTLNIYSMELETKIKFGFIERWPSIRELVPKRSQNSPD